MPEAVAGGSIGQLTDGDMIRLDAVAGTLQTDAELNSRAPFGPTNSAPQRGFARPLFSALRASAGSAEQGAGLYVCEMITSRGLVEGDQHTKDMLVFDELETTRSVQLYGTDPVYVGKATEILCAEYGVAHIDLNFGCPVPKVTRKGGGGALPWKRGLLADILEHAVRAAAPYGVPVTMKTRKGIDEDHLTYLDAGRIAQESGCAAIALHGRTVAQAYSGRADWDAIGELAASVDIPVLGNGDIWEAADALRMVEETGAAGVVVGRGCLGRPWLFRDLAAAFAGEEVATLPTLGEVRDMMRRHAELLCQHMGEERGCKEFRKHVSWYLKGFAAGGTMRRSLGLVSTLADLDALLADLDPDEPFPVAELGTPRGRQGSPRDRVVLPEGWLDDADGSGCAVEEDLHSGG
ncbi:tRNA dihydrouridine synthase DusB [Nocardioides sp. REDSEA-S30_B4]|uniref:tRNA dihydrouridine synthase DusB n=1 Tax=Nocardioides sp. REDSEA-S30_B4 TaxID=1811552 RepID=UPI000AC4C771|nr:tRNA dihydrouridine synthase DusB [Nocardioides sp. REDSEA-S30_B4]